MEKINKLLYSIVFILALSTSANAEWKMFASEDGTFMYDTEDGIIFEYHSAYKLDDGSVGSQTFHQISYHYRYGTPAAYFYSQKEKQKKNSKK